MDIYVVFVWIGITLACIWGSIYLVTKKQPDDWTGMMTVAIMLILIDTSRNWALLFDERQSMMFILRIITTTICAAILYAYAYLRLGLECGRERLLIAVLFPGAKFILAIIVKGLPKF